MPSFYMDCERNKDLSFIAHFHSQKSAKFLAPISKNNRNDSKWEGINELMWANCILLMKTRIMGIVECKKMEIKWETKDDQLGP